MSLLASTYDQPGRKELAAAIWLPAVVLILIAARLAWLNVLMTMGALGLLAIGLIGLALSSATARRSLGIDGRISRSAGHRPAVRSSPSRLGAIQPVAPRHSGVMVERHGLTPRSRSGNSVGTSPSIRVEPTGRGGCRHLEDFRMARKLVEVTSAAARRLAMPWKWRFAVAGGRFAVGAFTGPVAACQAADSGPSGFM